MMAMGVMRVGLMKDTFQKQSQQDLLLDLL